MIRFRCRRCREVMTVPDSQAGQFEPCPTCKHICEVPRPQSPPPPARNVSESSPADATSGRTVGGPSPRAVIYGLAALSIGAWAIWLLGVFRTGNMAANPWMPYLAGGIGVLAVGLGPWAIAAGKRMPAATAIGLLGVLGIGTGILWLVALVWAVAGQQAAPAEQRRPCPSCGESIALAARKCRFCSQAL